MGSELDESYLETPSQKKTMSKSILLVVLVVSVFIALIGISVHLGVISTALRDEKTKRATQSETLTALKTTVETLTALKTTVESHKTISDSANAGLTAKVE